jgi:hypothetical protein
MDNNSQDSVGSIAEQVLSYLSRHPEAKDTIEGITEWWLLEQRIHVAEMVVKKALADLVDRGLIVQNRAGDGKVYYSLNKERTN